MVHNVKLYPRIFESGKKQKIYVSIEDFAGEVAIRVQPLEEYSIKHSANIKILEQERYPYMPMTSLENGLYFFEYGFTAEQKYSVCIAAGEIKKEIYVYALDSDLMGLMPFKGDTHIHTTGSDGAEPPFEVAINYRNAGFDFICVTDHHKMQPSVDLKKEIEALTDTFTVFRGEEVHNKSMGYFHVINFDGEISVNDIIETDDAFVEAQIKRIMEENDFSGISDPRYCAYRMFIAEQIRRGGGLAVLPHPFWECGGEYNAQPSDVKYLLKSGFFDAFEVLDDCDNGGNGENLQIALWQEHCIENGYMPVLAASDAHTSIEGKSGFNKYFSIVFAKDLDGIKSAVKDGKSVAVYREDDRKYLALGKFRYVKYARFLLDEYFPYYTDTYAQKHARLLAKGDKNELKKLEKQIAEYQNDFFNRGIR